MDPRDAELRRLLAGKERRRRKLAALPFPDKVRMVVQLQQRVAPVLRARGRLVRIWKIESAFPPHV